jgi:arabinogalactan endo-1,4-beta-galactosidase
MGKGDSKMTLKEYQEKYGIKRIDFNKVKKSVPVVWADLADAGHNPGYWEEAGGRFPKLALKWMDWQLKGYKQNARIFLKPDLKGFDSHWSIKTRNFTAADKKYDAPFEDMETETDTVFDRAALDSTFCFGADVSSTTLMTRQSKTFYNRSGVKRTVMPILKEQGVNSVRLRVLVNPTGGDFNSTYSKTLATQAKTQGMSIMLDLHYCDWWGDNVKPRAWKSHTLEKLLTDVKTHTTSVVRNFNGTGKLRWVQIGNEVDDGLLWEDGHDTAVFVSIVNTAYEAVKAVNPDVQTVLHVAQCEDTQWLCDYFDALQAAGAKWDAIGLSMHVKASTLTPEVLTAKVCENVKMLRERYDKPVFIVETGYYNDRQIEGNQWLCDLLMQLMGAGAAGLYYWEPELADDYDLGAWNPLTRKPSLSLDAFLGVKHYEPGTLAVERLNGDAAGSAVEYYTPGGLRIASPQRGLNIVRQRRDGSVRTIKIFR